MFECICCGDRERPALFSIRKGGLVCSACSSRTTDGVALKTSTLYAMQYIISSNVEKIIYIHGKRRSIRNWASSGAKAYLTFMWIRHFKSLEIT